MKSPLFLLRSCGLLLTALLYSCGTSPTGREVAQTKESVKTFFENYLSGEAEYYTDDTGFALSDLTRERELVWQAWKEANEAFEEEKLIPTRSIEQPDSGYWHLPAHLEPDAVLPYYWGSKGEKPDSGYPLFLYLHGSGNPVREWANGLRFAQTFEDAPSLYFVPQIPSTKYYRWYLRSKQYAYEKLLRQLFVSGEADPNRVYFFGISEGGYGSQRLASFYADYLAGAGPMAAGEPLQNAPVENLRNTAFSLRTGDEDLGFERRQLTLNTREEFERLQAEHSGGFVHNIELIPGRGHSIDYTPTTPWLKQHTRNPYPKVVLWENFEMDGGYRKGFYNLRVDERSNDNTSSRTYYQFAIDGNDLTLRADLVTYEATEKDPRWSIPLRFAKSYTPATKGKVTIYLSPELVDLDREITLTVNGVKAFQGKVKPELRHLVNSCALFFDPARLYPAAIEVDLQTLKAQ